VLGKLARQQDANVLVGFDTADDAGVYRIAADTALVQTVDFFTPVVDDPYTFGQVAATNSLSDVYAMGGRPLTALALVCFPEKGDLKILERVLAGGLSKMIEAGCTVIGGHSIRDDEIKFGYSVTGVVHPARVLANRGARPGDRLLFTKAIGTGVISTAIKQGKAGREWVDAATASMTTLNQAAAEVLIRCAGGDGAERATPVHALTDVTGFGLIGHAREMALASDVSLKISSGSVPLLKANREFAECAVEFGAGVSNELRTLLFDPQTAGGLLASVGADHAGPLLEALAAAGVGAAEIGKVVARTQPLIEVS
jgi:selenide,water dikinase